MINSIADSYKPSSNSAKRNLDLTARSKRRNSSSAASSSPQRCRRATVDTPASVCRPRPAASAMAARRLSLPTRKSVQFSDLSEVCVLDDIAFSSSSSRWRWYSVEDHLRFKRERISDVVSFKEQSRRNRASALSSGSGPVRGGASGPADPPSPGSSCPVGLEHLLSTRGLMEAQSARKTVIQSVLQEQDRQRFFGFRDPDSIAVVSVRLSEGALEGAVRRGRFQEMAKFV